MDSPVYATANGIVQKAEYNSSYGNFILINHKYGYSSLYGHNSKLYVFPGQKVYRGQVISKIGSTGLSTGPHVHYEVLIGNYSLDPVTYMGRWF
jgi:murein DD-endopeptidase MepM/ murein hydrolase activator NlpD